MAHSRGACPEHPATMAAMHGCYRVLLISAADVRDSRLGEQMRTLQADPAGLRERDLIILPLQAAAASLQAAAGASEPALQLPVAHLAATEANRTQEDFRIHEAFTVVLVGKDGGEKLRSHEPLTLDQLFHRIDGMPMRRNEMRERR